LFTSIAIAAALTASTTLALALGFFDGGGGDDVEHSAGSPDTSVPRAEVPEATSEGVPPSEVTPVIINGGTGLQYLEPVPLVPGKYESPLASREAWDRGIAASNAEKDGPQFEGVVNGFRIWSYEHALRDESVMKPVCGGEDYTEWRLVEKLKFTYLPPGTAAEAPQQEAMCPDGSAGWTGQNFVIRDGPALVIWYETGERAFPVAAPADRVAAGEVQGRPAVTIRPVTEEGFDVSWVAFATDHGFIGIHAVNLLLGETIKIAEGVTCETC
jgi:hypothetical protein